MNEIRRELVLFRFRRVTAKTVAIAGILGDWHPSFAPMEKCGDGIWQKYLHLCPGEHQYRLIVDGDWDATGSRTVTVPEPADMKGSFPNTAGALKRLLHPLTNAPQRK